MKLHESMSASSLSFVEGLYEEYLRDAGSVSAEWRAYFDGLSNGSPRGGRVGPTFSAGSIFNPAAGNGSNGAAHVPDSQTEMTLLQHRVDLLVRNFRIRGHTAASIDPLAASQPVPPELNAKNYGLSDADLDRPFSTDAIGGTRTRTLREILAILFNTYCRSIAVQFMHVDDLAIRQWLQERMENSENRARLSRDEQLRILMRLTDAVIFEDFLRKKYGTKKSFSLQGAESLIPLLDLTIEKAAAQGVSEIVMGMAHRGRLNVLANILGKSPAAIFREFEDRDPEMHKGRGDVKYHLGYDSEFTAAGGAVVKMALCFNPSHLEFVNPVAVGRVRAKQDRSGDQTRARSMALLIHGDAAFAGEGITQEMFNMSELAGYTTAGTLHVVVNNQVGFTTGPEQGRSSRYATAVAKMLHVPIFHVNGEDPEAVAHVVNLSMDFRQKFRRDVVIDMYCYRRLGHNEADEPAFTQPLMYKAIESRKSVREGYVEHLLKLNGVTREEADRLAQVRREHLERDLSKAKSDEGKPTPVMLGGAWSGYAGGADSSVADVDTGVRADRLARVMATLTKVPAGFTPHPKLATFLETRREMARGEKPLNWAAAEALALATLAEDGHRVRMTGQDCERGTFTQRHAVWHDINDGRRYCSLQHVAAGQAAVEIHNSPLSETGVMGFEYGYSLDCPEGLVMWEAQFGDFVNVAQVIIDQFIASAEEKWYRLSGLVLLLPHGMEGQGPEHSSARLERFLSLAAKDNMQIVYPSTPAQYFHVLRRQCKRAWRKPLIVMTPKSLLRLPACASSLADCAAGRFQRVIADVQVAAKGVKRILLCTGKIYYDLVAHREAGKRDDVAIVRIEQLYPFSLPQLTEALKPYAANVPVFWVQEEPANMGAWPFLLQNFDHHLLGRPFKSFARPAAASPATGSESSHHLEQGQLIAEAFGETFDPASMKKKK
jgi:2-oxoglutarate dehydrogenase E1 component